MVEAAGDKDKIELQLTVCKSARGRAEEKKWSYEE
jgi:hypothetical protein